MVFIVLRFTRGKYCLCLIKKIKNRQKGKSSEDLWLSEEGTVDHGNAKRLTGLGPPIKAKSSGPCRVGQDHSASGAELKPVSSTSKTTGLLRLPPGQTDPVGQ